MLEMLIREQDAKTSAFHMKYGYFTDEEALKVIKDRSDVWHVNVYKEPDYKI
jgi:hypothetical protein